MSLQITVLLELGQVFVCNAASLLLSCPPRAGGLQMFHTSSQHSLVRTLTSMISSAAVPGSLSCPRCFMLMPGLTRVSMPPWACLLASERWTVLSLLCRVQSVGAASFSVSVLQCHYICFNIFEYIFEDSCLSSPPVDVDLQSFQLLLLLRLHWWFLLLGWFSSGRPFAAAMPAVVVVA